MNETPNESPGPARLHLARFGVGLAMLVILGPAVLVAARAALAPGIGSIAVSLAIVLLLAAWTARGFPARFRGRGSVVSFVVWLVACGLVAYQLSGVAIFMGDASLSEVAYHKPDRVFEDDGFNGSLIPGHYCSTAYVVASQLATDGADDIYDPSLYGPVKKKRRTIVHEQIGDTFTIDDYHYPPPFLLLPKLLMVVGGGVHPYRSLLYGLELVVLFLVLNAFARWISPDRFGAAWFALPVLLLVPDTLTTLQIGNVHFLILCLAMGGMLALEQGRHALGGLLLAFGIVGKLFPAVLLVYLAARRAWRSLAFTAGAVVLYSLVTLAVFGWSPFQAFLFRELPRLASGEAFEGLLALPIVKVCNVSIAGIAPKLDLLGWTDGESGTLAAVLTIALSVLLLLASIGAGWRHHRVFGSSPDAVRSPGSRAALAGAWLALLVLAQLGSPLLPAVYGNLATVWLVCILAAGARRASASWFLPAGLLLAIPVTLPFGPPTPTLDLGFTLATPVVTLVLAAWAAFRLPEEPEEPEEPANAADVGEGAEAAPAPG